MVKYEIRCFSSTLRFGEQTASHEATMATEPKIESEKDFPIKVVGKGQTGPNLENMTQRKTASVS